MTNASEEALEHIFCIHYPVQFKNTDKAPVQGLINSGSEVNAIYQSFVKQLGLTIRPIDIGVQKIDKTTLDTYGIVVAVFSVVVKTNRVRFFEEIFLVANVSPKVVLGMPFLILSDADIDFSGWELWWTTYTTEEVLPTIRRVKLVGKKEFATASLNPEYKTYVVYIVSLSSIPLASLGSTLLNIYGFQRPQISGLIVEEASTKISAKYSDFADVYFPDLTSELPEYTRINNYAIELVDD